VVTPADVGSRAPGINNLARAPPHHTRDKRHARQGGNEEDAVERNERATFVGGLYNCSEYHADGEERRIIMALYALLTSGSGRHQERKRKRRNEGKEGWFVRVYPVPAYPPFFDANPRTTMVEEDESRCEKASPQDQEGALPPHILLLT
jgi:hypothetical protein